MWRALAILVMVAVGSVAGADVDQAVERRFEAGQEAYERGDYPAAIAAFEEVYAATGDAGVLFNLAQAHRLARDCGKAAARYREYLPHAEPGERGIIEHRIAEMDACTERAPEPVKVVPPPPPAAPAPARPGHGSRWKLGLGLTIAGGVVLGAGAVFGVLARGEQDDLDACGCSASQAADIVSAGQRDERLAVAGFVGGGALLATGLILWLWPEAEGAAVTPTPGGAMASMTWSWR